MNDVRGLSIRRDSDSVPEPPRRLGTRVVLPCALIAAAVLMVLFAAREALWPAPAVIVEPVIAGASLVDGTGTTSVTASGWIAPDPFAIQVVAMTAGVVAEVLALDGAEVEAGQIVARLVPDDAQIAVSRARAARDAASAAIDAIESERPKIAAAIAAAEGSIAATREELELKRSLAEEQLLSAAEVARLRARLGVEQAGLLTAQARGPELEARLAQGRAELDIAVADLAAAELWLTRTEIRAPSRGVVLRRAAAPGTVVGAPGAAASPVVMELYDPGRLMVRADVPFADAARIGLGQRAIVTVEALPDREFAARVARAVQIADVAKNTLSFHVTLEDTDPVLRPDMITRVRFLAGGGPDAMPRGQSSALFVPRRALRDDRVLVVVAHDGDRGRIAVREVTLGHDRDDYVEVTSGVVLGDRVVVDGPADLIDGQLVEVVERGDRR